jgi:hypothetical protein
MNLDHPELNEPFTARLLKIMESATHVANKVLSMDGVDDESIMAIVTRCSLIESRSLMFLSCLHDANMEQVLKEISVDDELLFMDASEEFIKDIGEMLNTGVTA